MNPLLVAVIVLAVVGFTCGALAAATGGNTPPPHYRRDPRDDELDALIDEETGRG